MNSTSEENSELRTLLALAHQGDQRAFNELIEAASVRLQRMARMMLANYPHLRRWEQTDDVLQVATLRLHRALTDVRPDSARHFFALAATQDGHFTTFAPLSGWVSRLSLAQHAATG